MVEIDHTCMEAIVPRVKFIKPMGYEMSAELIDGYAQIILQLEIDTSCARWGTYEEKIREVQSSSKRIREKGQESRGNHIEGIRYDTEGI